MQYFVFTDSSFSVLLDQNTVIGVCKAHQNTIIKQSIADFLDEAVTYTTKMRQIFTVAVGEHQNVLFVAGSGSSGQLVQFELSTGRAIKIFGLVGKGTLKSSINANNLWFFGGHGLSEFAVIDLVSRQVLGNPVRSAVTSIFSMTVCKKLGRNDLSQVLLLTVGAFANYSENQTDMFDITALVNRHSNSSNKLILSID